MKFIIINRRREHAYEMIDSTSTGLQIRESHHLLIPTVSGGKRHSRDSNLFQLCCKVLD